MAAAGGIGPILAVALQDAFIGRSTWPRADDVGGPFEWIYMIRLALTFSASLVLTIAGYLIALLASRRLLRNIDGHLSCIGCGYLLTGLTSKKCPECGLELSKARP